MSLFKKGEKKKKSKARVVIEWVLLGVFGAAFAFLMAGTIEGMVHKAENYNKVLRFGWGSFTVETNSMEPEYPVGTAIITHKDDPDDIYKYYIDHDILAKDMAKEKNDYYIDITFYNGVTSISEKPSNSQYTVAVRQQAVFTHRIVEIRVDPSTPKGKGHYLFFARGINDKGFASGIDQYQVFTETQILGVVKAKSNVLGWFFTALSSPWGLIICLLIPATYLVIVSVSDIFKGVKENEEKPASEGASASGEGGTLEGLSEEDRKRLKEEMLQQMLEEKMKGGKDS